MEQLKNDRGDGTMEKLLTAAIGVFGQHGFHGATTRMLTEAAGVNQQAIPYYFGGKEGLYIATAELIGAGMADRIGAAAKKVTRVLARADEVGEPVSAGEARRVLTEFLQTFSDVVVSDEAEAWAGFIFREQMAPTEAFERIHRAAMGPMLGMVNRLVGVLLSKDPASERVRLRTLSLISGIIVFRMSRATALRFLNWEAIGPRENHALRAHVADLVKSISHAT